MKTQKARQRLPSVVQTELKELGLFIRGARLKRQWTQKNLSERAAISITTLQRLEKGVSTVSFTAVCMICWLLDIPLRAQLDIGQAEYLKAIAEDRSRARLPLKENLDDKF